MKVKTMAVQTIIGPIIHSCDGQVQIHEMGRIDIQNGKIIKVDYNVATNNINKETVKYLKAGQFLIPGFIDGHIHAVQLPNLGLGYDKILLEWLDAYTFPLEKKYADNKFAEKVFDAVVKRTLKMGTTTACYYSSLHGPASLILAEKAAEYGQRALVGKVNMDVCTTDYCESFENSLRDTEIFIKNVQNINSPLVKPIITPRFALSCDIKLMLKLSDLAKENNIHIQTHISENKEEIKAVESHFADYAKSYASVYDEAGLLTKKTVLAHGIHLSETELELISDRESAIVHCPSSNTYLKSGLCDVRRLQKAKIKVGLGTDVSGGNFPSILDVMRAALQVSMHLSFIKSDYLHDKQKDKDYKPLNYKEVFHLATLGGAEALDMQEEVGNFVPGKQFDALVIDLASPNSVLDNLIDYTLEEKLQRFIYSGDDRNIVEVYVSGQRVV